MRITPLDIIQKEFGSVRRGLDPDEVGQFLEEVRETLEEVLRENRTHQESVKARDREIESLRARESEIHQTLMLARRMTEELKDTSRREADLLLGEARLEAQRVLSTAHDEHRELLQEVIQLQSVRKRLAAELRAVMETHLRLVRELEQPVKG